MTGSEANGIASRCWVNACVRACGLGGGVVGCRGDQYAERKRFDTGSALWLHGAAHVHLLARRTDLPDPSHGVT